MEGLKPSYRTISRFRKDNKEALKKVLEQSVKVCLELGLIEGNTLFLDGSKIRGSEGAKAEMALNSTCFNLVRMINLLGGVLRLFIDKVNNWKVATG